jgi:hypothetical protein
MNRKPVAIVVPQNAQSLDVSGPLDAFLEVNLLIGVSSRRRSASQAIDLPSDGGGSLGRLFTNAFSALFFVFRSRPFW